MKHLLLFLLMGMILSSCSYLPEEGGIDSNLRRDRGDYALYYSSEIMPEHAFFLVPGGLVDPYVYECWIDQLVRSDSSLAVVLVKYPSNLAITNSSKVMKVAGELPEFSHRVIGGHSLGGVVAASLVHDHMDYFDGLVLMASWAIRSSDLSTWDGMVLSVYASKDQLATGDEIFQYSEYLPRGDSISSPGEVTGSKGVTYYYEIAGGNHSGFGCYGQQEGDGEATISSAEQQDELVHLLTSFFNALW